MRPSIRYSFVFLAPAVIGLVLCGCLATEKQEPLPYYENAYQPPVHEGGQQNDPAAGPAEPDDPEHENANVPLPPALQTDPSEDDSPPEEDGEGFGGGDTDTGATNEPAGEDNGGTDDGGAAPDGGSGTGTGAASGGGDPIDPGDDNGSGDGEPDDPVEPPGPKVCSEIAHTRMAKVIYQKEVPSCGYGGWDMGTHLAALSMADFQDSKMCGACIRIDGPTGHTIAKVIDKCKFCAEDEIVMTEEAFQDITTDDPWNWVKAKWQLVSCPVEGPVRYHYKFGSSPYWTAVQVRNARHPIKRLEYSADNGQTFSEPEFEDWNYYVDGSGMGNGPYTFRITDMFDQVIVDKGIELLPDDELPGQNQFPECP